MPYDLDPGVADWYAELRAAYAALGSYEAVAEAKNTSKATVWRAMQAVEREARPVKPEPDPVEKERERVAQEAKRKEHVEAVKELGFRQFLEELCHETVDRLPAPPPPRQPKVKFNQTTESLVVSFSDWHYAEKVKRESVQDLNHYDRKTAATRVYSVVQKIISIQDRMGRGGWSFPRLVVGANGDMISGSIHEVEKHSDPNNVILSAYECGRLLALALRDLAKVFPEVMVVCTSGNHGRLPDHKRPASKEPARNWDTLIYLIARTALEGVKNVQFHIPDSYTAVFEVEGHLFGQSHGHDIRGWMHTPVYGFNRMVSSLNSIRVHRGQPIDYFLFGHFHNKTSVDYGGSEYFINGSLIGGTEYSVNALGKADRPCQWLLGVHKDHGVTHRWPICPDDDGEYYEVESGIG